jgi:hypothetical protein
MNRPIFCVRFQVLTASSMKMTMMEAGSTSETLVNFYETTRRKKQFSYFLSSLPL